MANQLIVAPAPHVQTAQSTTRIMRDVVIALMPALVVSAVVFGLDVLRVTALSVVSCVVIEYLIQKFMVRGATTVGNWSAVVTGVLLAFNLLDLRDFGPILENVVTKGLPEIQREILFLHIREKKKKRPEPEDLR